MSISSSGDPVDRLIRRTIQTGYLPSDEETQAMIQHIAGAPFARHQTRIDPYYREMAIANGFHVPLYTDALTAHVAKHVWAQQQWVATTTEAEYLYDIQVTIRASSARLVVYTRSRRPRAAIVGPTEEIVPVERRGPREGRYIVVVYAPEHAMIVTAHMTATQRGANIPAGAIWLT